MHFVKYVIYCGTERVVVQVSRRLNEVGTGPENNVTHFILDRNNESHLSKQRKVKSFVKNKKRKVKSR